MFVDDTLSRILTIGEKLRESKDFLHQEWAKHIPPAPTLASVHAAIMRGLYEYAEILLPTLAILAVPHNQDWLFSQPGLKDDPTAQAAIRASSLANTSANAKSFEAGFPSARIVRLPDADHYIFNSNEAEVFQEMNSFLESLT